MKAEKQNNNRYYIKMHEWNIMCYTFTDNDLEVGSFKDLAKLTCLNRHYQNVIIHMLIDTSTMGSYLIKIRGNPYIDNMMTIKRLPNQDMSKCETLCGFIKDSVKDALANRYALILGGHGSGWFLLTEKDSVLPSATLGNILRTCSVHFDLVCFDNCMMSTLESINEVYGSVKYVTAYQDYAGWDGIIESTLLKHFDDTTKSTLDIAKELAKALIIKTNQKLADPTSENKPDPTDVSVICMEHVPNLVSWIKKNLPFKGPSDNRYCVDPGYWHLQDLASIVKNSYSESCSDIQQFTDLFNQVVVFYEQSANKHNPLHHGLSCIVDPEKDIYDTQQTWKLLSLRLQFV